MLLARIDLDLKRARHLQLTAAILVRRGRVLVRADRIEMPQFKTMLYADIELSMVNLPGMFFKEPRSQLKFTGVTRTQPGPGQTWRRDSLAH